MASSLLGCIRCNHKSVVKNGFYRDSQVYRCKKCGASFTENSTSPYAWHRFPKNVIAFAVMLRVYGMSGQDISDILYKRNKVKVSAWTVCKWAVKFGSLDDLHSALGIKYSDVWHVDEMFIRANGRMNYLFVVIDDKSNVIALHISERRSKQAAIAALKKARRIAGKPAIVVTDEWNAYPSAIRKTFGRGKVRHCQAHFKRKRFWHNGSILLLSNNRIEGCNSWLRRIYRGMRGFKSIASAQLFFNAYALFWNIGSGFWDVLMSL